jgi:cytochrome c oxidase subunit IV
MTDHSAAHSAVPGRYFVVYAALLVLTFTTYGVAYVPLGEWHVAAALGIAVVKAAMVVLIFMHLNQSSKLTWLVVASGLFTLTLLIGLTVADYWTRSWLDQAPLANSPSSVWWQRP